MRTVSGHILVPEETAGQAKVVTIEIRDVSIADAPSTVLASQTLRNVAFAANAPIRFSLKAPEAPGRRLALRVQVDGASTPGRPAATYLTTQSIDVKSEGDVTALEAPLTAI